MRELAPIVLFVYNRPWHARQTIEALQKNELANKSELFIYSDAAKNHKDASSVKEVRDYIHNVTGFKRIQIIERDKNWGLASSIIDGVTRIVNRYDSVIVLEDDLVTSPYFLDYMNESLDRHAKNDRVISIHGYVYPIQQALPEAFFLKSADCWGWATWKRGWSLFNSNGRELYRELKRRQIIKDFDFNGSYGFSAMLKEQVQGKNDSWAIRWYASAFLADKLTLYPGKSLVHNIGNDNSGTHCASFEGYNVDLTRSRIDLSNIAVEPSSVGFNAFVNYFTEHKRASSVKKIVNKAKSYWGYLQ